MARCCCSALTGFTLSSTTMRCAELLAQDATVEVIARSVVSAALERGSRDNVTALVVRYSDN